MSESPNLKQEQQRNGLLCFICFGACVALASILLYILGLTSVRSGELTDSDCYLRLVRVQNLYNGGSWYDPVLLRINPPYGQTYHWTRPLDILLLAGAAPIALFTNFKSALFWWGVIISPVLLIATLIALQWATKPVLSGEGTFLVGLVFIFQLVIFTSYEAGRPDHHSLLILVFVLSVGLTLRMIAKPFDVRLCYIAGAVSGFSMWISVESMLPTCIVLMVFSLLWIMENDDYLSKNLYYAIALFATIGISLVLERAWFSLLVKEYDRLSIVHFSIFGFIALAWIALAMLNAYTLIFRTRANRLLSFVVCTTILALVVFLSFPKFYNGPFVGIDPRLIHIWLSKIIDTQPLVSEAGPVVIPVQLIGSALIGFIFLVYFLRKETSSTKRKCWGYLLFSSVICMLIAIYQIRWSIYPQVLLIIPMTQLMVLMRRQGPSVGFLKMLKNILILMVFSVGLLFVGLVAERVISKRKGQSTGFENVRLVRMCDYLAHAKQWDGQSLLILTDVDFGPEILYRTEHEVLSVPHATGTPGRNGQGIFDTYEIMTADTDEKAHELIQKRKIDLILLCPKSTESEFYSKPGHESTFYKRLCGCMIPSWSKKVKLPPDLSSSFLLFETTE